MEFLAVALPDGRKAYRMQFKLIAKKINEAYGSTGKVVVVFLYHNNLAKIRFLLLTSEIQKFFKPDIFGISTFSNEKAVKFTIEKAHESNADLVIFLAFPGYVSEIVGHEISPGEIFKSDLKGKKLKLNGFKKIFGLFDNPKTKSVLPWQSFDGIDFCRQPA